MTSLPIPRTHAARRATPTGPSVSVLDRNHVTPTAQSWVRTGAATHAAIPLGARPVAGPVTIVPMARETKGLDRSAAQPGLGLEQHPPHRRRRAKRADPAPADHLEQGRRVEPGVDRSPTG
jgi:hypothetical protein